MDISYWNNFKKPVLYTTKQFFGKYLWRLQVYAEGGKLITSEYEDLVHALKIRERAVNYNYAGYWRRKPVDRVNFPLLYAVRHLRQKYGEAIRLRIEEPEICFYAADEETLKEIADDLSTYSSEFMNITGPADKAAEEILKTGAILSNRTSEYSHKVIIRDGRYDFDVKQQILSYLDSLGNLVKLSSNTRDMLNKRLPNVWGLFFYTNDPDIVTFIRLIDPKFVLNVHPLIQK